MCFFFKKRFVIDLFYCIMTREVVCMLLILWSLLRFSLIPSGYEVRVYKCSCSLEKNMYSLIRFGKQEGARFCIRLMI